MTTAPPWSIELVDAFGAGIYLLMAITHADLWWHRRDRPAHFWLALSASGALLVNVTGAVIRRFGESFSVWLLALNVLGIAAALISLYEVVQALRGTRSGRIVRMLQSLTLLPIAFLPFATYEQVASPLFIGSAMFLLAAMVQAIRHALSGDRESRVMASGLVVLFAVLIYDMASELKLLPRIEGMPVLGFTILFIAAARALSLRYDREHRELVTLRGELESRVHERTAALEAANRELDRLSHTDPLTGLANRRSFFQSANGRDIRTHALLMLDVDHFKRINDTHGHDAGDTVLRALASMLAETVRSGELVARWGGEEFILLLADEGASERAEALRRTLADQAIHAGGARLHVTASIGLSPAASTGTLDERLTAADRALYRAKQQGRNCVVVAAA